MHKAAAVLLCVLTAACRQPATETRAPAKRRVMTVIIPENDAKKRALDAVHVGPLLFDRVLLGTQLDAGGAVSTDSARATEGQPFYVTVRLRESPVGLHIGVVWKDAHGKKIAGEEKPMNGGKVATFAMPRTLAAGRYTAETYWGAPPGIDKQFEVVGKKQPRR
jgi:hypothetical protein